MGRAEQVAKQIFRRETEAATGGGVGWFDAPEIPTPSLTPDGLLRRSATVLGELPDPWPRLREEATLEIKMPGDHVDLRELGRVELRRQARWVQRLESDDALVEHPEQVAAWVAASYLPPWLREASSRTSYTVERLSPGCYRLGPLPYSLLWLAANELPLHPSLLPFLVARSGRALVEFVLWAMTLRGPVWVLDLLEELPMAMELKQDLEQLDDAAYEVERLRVRDELLLAWIDRAPSVQRQVAQREQQHLLYDLLEHKLGRSLLEAEEQALVGRLKALGAKRLGDALLDLTPDALTRWLLDPNAR